jgi:hypothetical protein
MESFCVVLNALSILDASMFEPELQEMYVRSPLANDAPNSCLDSQSSF